MAGRAFKVSIPTNYNNVTEAKLVQKGSEVWVQLPANMVQDKRMSRSSVYMQDFNKNNRHSHRHRNIKAKVVTRHTNNPHPREDFLGFRGDPTQFKTKNCMDLNNHFDLNEMLPGSNYARKKSKSGGPVKALLPVMDTGCLKTPELLMDHHYATPRKMSSSRSYNDKAREALPGLGKWLQSGDMHDVVARKHSGIIDGDDFLENPLLRSDEINRVAVKRSVAIRTPPQMRHSPRSSALGRRLHEGSAVLDSGNLPVTLDPPYFENSAKRHELEILTRVNPTSQDSTMLDHLYQPTGYTNRPGYTVVGKSYEHENANFSHTGPTQSSFDISPDWVSERKKSVVIPH